MRPNLITRLKEEWNNLDPVDPLRGLIADAIDALAERNRAWTQDHWTEYERSIAAAAKEEEREACAKVCEEIEGRNGWSPSCTNAIRARGETK